MKLSTLTTSPTFSFIFKTIYCINKHHYGIAFEYRHLQLYDFHAAGDPGVTLAILVYIAVFVAAGVYLFAWSVIFDMVIVLCVTENALVRTNHT